MVDSPYPPVQAYLNTHFIEGREGRALRILSEYIEPDARFEAQNVEDTIIFFGSARTLPRDVAEEQLAEARKNNGDVKRAEMDLHMSRYYEDSRELGRRLTEWSKGLEGVKKRFVLCTGGGPGIMEAGNRGASEAKGLNMGFNITLPFEQHQNPYITRQLSFEFRYFFMRKFWFMYLAKAMVAFPGGFGTMDELFEALTLIQTDKVSKRLPIVLYGKEFWDDVVNLDALVKYGTISPEDMELFTYCDTVDEAYDYLTSFLEEHALEEMARSDSKAP
ncbi:putative lysine decarboxylase family [Candidatus Terasakiella magnetica]|uniref:AMP nucleosidase n=1 Tax=Candidatus Terasakiella magnetica TaxID=1867952 RepID=A0A1C3RLQ3_9PROT|nr:LOG family protein [Candidatus Terasakiella magnetica]SCA58252.1 putative lysine decarboxylase family [Candidatus Terasakiella magnetica]